METLIVHLGLDLSHPTANLLICVENLPAHARHLQLSAL